MIGPLISAGANLVGGIMSQNAQQDYNAQQLHQTELNRKTQEEFAKKGIRWKVADAKAAGIHPLYALGAQTSSFSNVSLGGVPETGLAQGLANAGQDISRAVNATRTQPERDAAFTKTVQDLSLVEMGLKNELLASQIAKLKTTINPAMPTLGDPVPEAKKPEDRPQLYVQGRKLSTDPGTSPAKAWEDALGDDITSPGFWPNAFGIAKSTMAQMSALDWLRIASQASPSGLARYNWGAIPKSWR